MQEEHNDPNFVVDASMLDRARNEAQETASKKRAEELDALRPNFLTHVTHMVTASLAGRLEISAGSLALLGFICWGIRGYASGDVFSPTGGYGIVGLILGGILGVLTSLISGLFTGLFPLGLWFAFYGLMFGLSLGITLALIPSFPQEALGSHQTR